MLYDPEHREYAELLHFAALPDDPPLGWLAFCACVRFPTGTAEVQVTMVPRKTWVVTLRKRGLPDQVVRNGGYPPPPAWDLLVDMMRTVESEPSFDETLVSEHPLARAPRARPAAMVL